jgi:hypothetical protein
MMTAGTNKMLGVSKVFEVNFGHWWVDDEGAWNFWGLDRPIDPEDRERSALNYRRMALHRLGMVQVTRRRDQDLVEFDLHRVHDTALDATVDFLTAATNPGAVELRFYHRAWNIEHYPDGTMAARRIQEVRGFRGVVYANTVTSLNQSLSAESAITPPIRDALRLVDAGTSKLTLRDCADLIPRLIVYRRDDRPGSAQWVSLFAGNLSGGAWVFGQNWIREAHGRPFQIEEPGRRYSIEIMRAYAGVLNAGEPRLDHIRAIIRRPAKDPLWVPYQRLLFRAIAENGEPLLCCLSEITQDIAIPFMRASA